MAMVGSRLTVASLIKRRDVLGLLGRVVLEIAAAIHVHQGRVWRVHLGRCGW